MSEPHGGSTHGKRFPWWGHSPETALPALAVIFARAGELPPDAYEVITEAGGYALIVGDRAEAAATAVTANAAAGTGTLAATAHTTTASPATAAPGAATLASAATAATPGATTPATATAAAPGAATPATAAPGAATPATAETGARVWWCDTGPWFQPGRLAARLAAAVEGIKLLLLPGTPDGRDLAPRLAATLGRPLLSRAARAEATSTGVRAQLCRLDDRVLVPAEVVGAAVVTMEPGAGAVTPLAGPPPEPVTLWPLPLPGTGHTDTSHTDPGQTGTGPTHPGQTGTSAAGTSHWRAGHPPPAGGGTGTNIADVTVLEVLEPDPAAIDLAEAPLVFCGGAGLTAGLDGAAARATFGLLADVAAAVGACAGATRVATDAGWAAPDRQIGTTGVVIHPRLYVAFGVSGAVQHTSGLGTPSHTVSVNTDPHCPMTALSSLGIVADARQTLIELAGLLGVSAPAVPPVGTPGTSAAGTPGTSVAGTLGEVHDVR